MAETPPHSQLNVGDLAASPEPRRRNRPCSGLNTRPLEWDLIQYKDHAGGGKSPLLKTLLEAEAAANSAAIQLASFKEAMGGEFANSRQCDAIKHRISRRRGLLMEKLEDFKQINKSLRQKLKKLQEAEVNRSDTDKQIDILLKKVSQAESENFHLKRNLSETETRLEELMDLRREEQQHTENTVNMNKSVEASRAHLQGQLRLKEADNNRLTVQLRTMEKTQTMQKMEVDELKGAINTLSEKMTQEKEALKKAARAHKQRAERFEAAIDKCYAQLREKNVALARAHSERDSWRRQQEQTAEEQLPLVAQIDQLKCQVNDTTARLQREKDDFAAANLAVTQRVEELQSRNNDMSVESATLKAAIAVLEKQLVQSEEALLEERMTSEERKHQAAQHQRQAAELQAEVHELRMKYQNVVRETESERARKDEEVEKVRRVLQGRVDALESYPGLLGAAEQSLLRCQENLRHSKREASEKTEAIRTLQVQMDSQNNALKNSVEVNKSIHEANVRLREQADVLQKKMEAIHLENLELVRKLAAQEETLSFSRAELDQRSVACQALGRQLEAALMDVKLQVTSVRETAASREGALQDKLLQLEQENSKREVELKRLRQSKLSAEKQFKVRLRDLQQSLDQSESHRQSIESYVSFLKSTYDTMFDEVLPAPGFGSSYLLK